MASPVHRFKMNVGDRKVEQYCTFGNGFVEICSRDTTGREVVIRHNFGNNQNGLGSTRLVRDPYRKPTP